MVLGRSPRRVAAAADPALDHAFRALAILVQPRTALAGDEQWGRTRGVSFLEKRPDESDVAAESRAGLSRTSKKQRILAEHLKSLLTSRGPDELQFVNQITVRLCVDIYFVSEEQFEELNACRTLPESNNNNKSCFLRRNYSFVFLFR